MHGSDTAEKFVIKRSNLPLFASFNELFPWERAYVETPTFDELKAQRRAAGPSEQTLRKRARLGRNKW
jgi:hypothetical protein